MEHEIEQYIINSVKVSGVNLTKKDFENETSLFEDYGVSSLKMMAIVSQIESEVGVEIIDESTTINSLYNLKSLKDIIQQKM